MKLIKEFMNYYVDEKGIVYTKTGKVKKQNKNKKGYMWTHLTKDKKLYTRFIHRLVYETYIYEIPKGMTVDHKDCNKENNNLDNLEMMTQKENLLKFQNNRNFNNIILDGFRKIEGFEDYQINKEGVVYSLKWGKPNLITARRRKLVRLRKNNKGYLFNEDILVYNAFHKF